jgi:hypothetical protein
MRQASLIHPTMLRVDHRPVLRWILAKPRAHDVAERGAQPEDQGG